jgi:hypothetical protein
VRVRKCDNLVILMYRNPGSLNLLDLLRARPGLYRDCFTYIKPEVTIFNTFGFGDEQVTQFHERWRNQCLNTSVYRLGHRPHKNQVSLQGRKVSKESAQSPAGREAACVFCAAGAGGSFVSSPLIYPRNRVAPHTALQIRSYSCSKSVWTNGALSVVLLHCMRIVKLSHEM